MVDYAPMADDEKGREIRCVGKHVKDKRSNRETCNALLFVFVEVPEGCPCAIERKCDRCDHMNKIEGRPPDVGILDRLAVPA